MKRIRKIPDDDDDEFSNEDYKTEVTLLKEVLKSPEEFEEILEFDHVISDDFFVKENAFYETLTETSKIYMIDEDAITTFLIDCCRNEIFDPLFNRIAQMVKFKQWKF